MIFNNCILEINTITWMHFWNLKLLVAIQCKTCKRQQIGPERFLLGGRNLWADPGSRWAIICLEWAELTEWFTATVTMTEIIILLIIVVALGMKVKHLKLTCWPLKEPVYLLSWRIRFTSWQGPEVPSLYTSFIWSSNVMERCWNEVLYISEQSSNRAQAQVIHFRPLWLNLHIPRLWQVYGGSSWSTL